MTIGFVINQSKRQKMCELFRDPLPAAGIDPRLYLALPVLSDEASAVTSYERRRTAAFRCFRHLIESFGVQFFLAPIVRHLLFSGWQVEHGRKLPQDLSTDSLMARDPKAIAERKAQ
jgi:hypothetical protein